MPRKRTATHTPLIADPSGGGDDAYARVLDVELPQAAPKSCGLSLASFFCGCGGVDLGFRSAGFKLAFANDLYARAAESFEANLGHKPLLDDIRKVIALKDIPEVDVLTGGFPCVTFSTAGQRQGAEDTVNGMLYLELCRMIEQRRPKYFVAENVKGMVTSNGGSDIKLILAAFLRLGYRTTYELINMAEHGVPQTRERVIFVGVRVDQWRGKFKYPEKTHRLRKDTKAERWLIPARTLRQAIGDLPGLGKTVGMMHGDAASKLTRPKTMGSFSNSNPRHVDDPSHSQTTQPNVLLVHNHDQISGAVETSSSDMRRMTVRECARVQSFPDWFEFKGSQADGYRQVGNAVPPLYAKRLAMALIEYDRRKIR